MIHVVRVPQTLPPGIRQSLRDKTIHKGMPSRRARSKIGACDDRPG